MDKIETDPHVGTDVLPILPLKGTVVYPFLVVPLMIQQPEQTRLVDEALMRGSRVGMFLQKDPNEEKPGPDGLHHIGTAGNILKMLRFPDGTVRFLIQGLSRIRIKQFTADSPHLTAEIEELEEKIGDPVKMEALQRSLMERIKKLADLAPYLNEEFQASAINQDTPSKLTDFIASNLNMSPEQRQRILAEVDIGRRAQILFQIVNKEIEILELSQKIQAQAASELGKSQRHYILREQLKAIKKELGDADDQGELGEFEQKITEAGMTEVAEKAARKELERLSHMQPSSAEYTPRLAGESALGCVHRRPAGAEKSQEGARRRPLQFSRGQGSHPGIPRRTQAQVGRQRPDPVLPRPSRSRQDVPGAVDRASHGTPVRAGLAGRNARRSRDSRPPPHLYRFHAGADHSIDQTLRIEQPDHHAR